MAPARKRALTMPLVKPTRILWRKQKCADQTQSILFSKLPLEVRQLIYEYTCYFSDQMGFTTIPKGPYIHIFSHAGKLVWRRCSSVNRPCTPHCYRKFYSHGPRSLNLLAVVLTCRRIYSEAIDLLYSCNAFVYRSLTAITLFTSTVLPQRLRCIRLLRLEWIFRDYAIDYPYGTSAAYSEPVHTPFDGRWEALWEILTTRMTGLRDLYVRLEGDFRYGPTAWEERIFGPMQRMKGLQTLEVEVNWMPRGDLPGLSQVKVVPSTSKGQHWED